MAGVDYQRELDVSAVPKALYRLATLRTTYVLMIRSMKKRRSRRLLSMEYSRSGLLPVASSH